MEKRQLYVDKLKLRESTDNTPSRVVEGTAIVFNSPSQYLFIDDPYAAEREVILPQAITKEFLDTQDFVLTAYHNPEYVLGRSSFGKGSVKYVVDETGVHFSCEMPRTANGDEMLELIRRGDITGCSFIFTADYFNPECVEMKRETLDDGTILKVYYVKQVSGIYDFTLTYRPAYPATECSSRDLIKRLRGAEPQDNIETEIKENENNDTMNLTDEQFEELVERVCNKLKEREAAESENKEKENEPASEPVAEPQDSKANEPAAEPQDANTQEPVAEPVVESNGECENDECKKDETKNESEKEAERALNDLAEIRKIKRQYSF